MTCHGEPVRCCCAAPHRSNIRKVTLEVIGSMEIGSERKTVALSLNLIWTHSPEYSEFLYSLADDSILNPFIRPSIHSFIHVKCERPKKRNIFPLSSIPFSFRYTDLKTVLASYNR